MPSNPVCTALNRLIVAGDNEVVTLDAAARLLRNTSRAFVLVRQSGRRGVFRADLSSALDRLGGTAGRSRATTARLGVMARRLVAALSEPHEGDAFAGCARATDRTERAYRKVLKLALPGDIRFGLDRQCAEIQFDSQELRRLRWGAEPTALAESDAGEKVWREESSDNLETPPALAVAGVTTI